MKITLLKNYLKKALHQLSRIAKPNVNLPALESVYLKAEKGELTLKATNLEVGVEITIPCSIDKNGEVAVPLKILSNVIDTINDEKINILKKNDGIKIDTKLAKTNINGINVKEFPIIPKIKKGEFAKINSNLISKSIDQVIPAIAISNIRPDLASVYLKKGKDDLRFVSTDGFRLAEKVVSKENAAIDEGNEVESVIIPSQSAHEIMHIFKEIDEEAVILIDDNQIAIKTENIYFVSRIIDGNYPDYSQIIPKEFKIEGSLDKAKLVKSIKLVSLFASDDSSEIKFTFDDKNTNLNLEAKSSKIGEGKRDVKIDIKGGKVEILLNYRYLIDGVNSIKSDNIKFFLNDSSSPLLIKSSDKKEDYLYLLSPIKK